MIVILFALESVPEDHHRMFSVLRLLRDVRCQSVLYTCTVQRQQHFKYSLHGARRHATQVTHPTWLFHRFTISIDPGRRAGSSNFVIIIAAPTISSEVTGPIWSAIYFLSCHSSLVRMPRPSSEYTNTSSGEPLWDSGYTAEQRRSFLFGTQTNTFCWWALTASTDDSDGGDSWNFQRWLVYPLSLWPLTRKNLINKNTLYIKVKHGYSRKHLLDNSF